MRDHLREQLQATFGTADALERELGGGGMSRVFVARDESLGRDIVIKVITSDLAEEVSAERFTREVKLAARLQQANIVPVLTEALGGATAHAGRNGGLPRCVDGRRARRRVGHCARWEMSRARTA